MGQEIIEAPKVIEGEVLTDKPLDAETEKLYHLIVDCEEALEAILEVAQRIDHGMAEVRPNKPNREIVRVADAMLAKIRGVFEAVGQALEDKSDETQLLEGKTYGE